MLIKGIAFAGVATNSRSEMSLFVENVLDMSRAHIGGIEADLFALPDGSTFAVASPGGMGDTERSLGFVVDDVAQAAIELRDAGVRTDPDIASNGRFRYLHFRAPDGHLYELVEELSASESGRE
jgi:hypothetical protein